MTAPQTNIAVRAPVQTGAPVAALVPRSIEEAFRLSQAIAMSGLAPRGMDKPEQVLVAIMAGAEIGLAPYQAVQSFAVVNGRPTLWGDALVAVVKARGVKVRTWTEGEGEAIIAKCEVIRPDNGEITEAEFSVADAKKANLWGKAGPWQQYPKRMLKNRARAFALRDGCADMLRGVQVREEVEDYGARDVTPVAAPGLRERLEARHAAAEGFSQEHVAAELDDGQRYEDDAAPEEFGAEVEADVEVEAVVEDPAPFDTQAWAGQMLRSLPGYAGVAGGGSRRGGSFESHGPRRSGNAASEPRNRCIMTLEREDAERGARAFVCSNPQCGAVHFFDPRGPCHACRRADGSGSSTMARTIVGPTPDHICRQEEEVCACLTGEAPPQSRDSASPGDGGLREALQQIAATASGEGAAGTNGDMSDRLNSIEKVALAALRAQPSPGVGGEVREAVATAFREGFGASCEGFNGEHGADDEAIQEMLSRYLPTVAILAGPASGSCDAEAVGKAVCDFITDQELAGQHDEENSVAEIGRAAIDAVRRLATSSAEEGGGKCSCVGASGPNPDCGRCGGDGSTEEGGSVAAEPGVPDLWWPSDDPERSFDGPAA